MATKEEKRRRRLEQATLEMAQNTKATTEEARATKKESQQQTKLMQESADSQAAHNKVIERGQAAHNTVVEREQAAQTDEMRKQTKIGEEVLLEERKRTALVIAEKKEKEKEENEEKEFYDAVQEARTRQPWDEMLSSGLTDTSAAEVVSNLIATLDFDSKVDRLLSRKVDGRAKHRQRVDELRSELRGAWHSVRDDIEARGMEPFGADAPEFADVRDTLDFLAEAWAIGTEPTGTIWPWSPKCPHGSTLVDFESPAGLVEKLVTFPPALKKELWGTLNEQSLIHGISEGWALDDLPTRVGHLLVSSVGAPPQGEHKGALPPAEWFDDPMGRHQHRYWNGNTWTDHVADGGVVEKDNRLTSSGAEIIEFLRSHGVEVKPVVHDEDYLTLLSAIDGHDNCLLCALNEKFQAANVVYLMGYVAATRLSSDIELHRDERRTAVEEQRWEDAGSLRDQEKALLEVADRYREVERALGSIPNELRKEFAAMTVASLKPAIELLTEEAVALQRARWDALDAAADLIEQRDDEFYSKFGVVDSKTAIDVALYNVAPESVINEIDRIVSTEERKQAHRDAVSAYSSFRKWGFARFLGRGDQSLATGETFDSRFNPLRSQVGMTTLMALTVFSFFIAAFNNSWSIVSLIPFAGLVVSTILFRRAFLYRRMKKELSGLMEDARPRFYNAEEIASAEAELDQIPRKNLIWPLAILTVAGLHTALLLLIPPLVIFSAPIMYLTYKRNFGM